MGGNLREATVVSIDAMQTYTVQPLTPESTPLNQEEVVATSAEEAARLVTGLPLTRGQRGSRGEVRAKVYFYDRHGVKTMYRYVESTSP